MSEEWGFTYDENGKLAAPFSKILIKPTVRNFGESSIPPGGAQAIPIKLNHMNEQEIRLELFRILWGQTGGNIKSILKEHDIACDAIIYKSYPHTEEKGFTGDSEQNTTHISKVEEFLNTPPDQQQGL